MVCDTKRFEDTRVTLSEREGFDVDMKLTTGLTVEQGTSSSQMR